MPAGWARVAGADGRGWRLDTRTLPSSGGAWGGAQGHGLNTRPSQNLQKTLPSFLISGGQAAALDTRLFDKGKKEEEEE